MGLIHKTQFVPFIDTSTTSSPTWTQIKKSTTFTMALNPQTKTFDFISSPNPEEEIDSYQPALSQSLTMFDDEDDFDAIFDMVFHLPKGGDAHRDVLLCFYASKYNANTYALTEDEDIVAGKTYYTRSGTSPNYVYTPVQSPVKASLGTYYEVTATTTYYKAWKVDSVVKLNTLDSVNQSIDFDLALNKHETGAVTVTAQGVPTWVAGTWSGDVFTPASS